MKGDKIRSEYDSMAQVQAVLNIPVAIQRDAKKNGCDAFQHNRVKVLPLIRYLFDPNRFSEIDAKMGAADLVNWKARREKLAHDRDAKKLVLRDDIRRACESVMAELFAEVERFFVEEGPATLKGLTESQIIERARPLVESLKDKLKATALKPTDE